MQTDEIIDGASTQALADVQDLETTGEGSEEQSSEASEELEGGDAELLAKVQSLDAQTWQVDVVTQFGTSDPFLIDGDALVMHAIADDLVDWEHGGQFVHCCFVVEQLLARMHERGALIEVFFFEARTRNMKCGHRLMRDVIRMHLCRLHVNGLPLRVHCLPELWISKQGQEAWDALTLSMRSSCIITSNGAHSGDESLACGFVHWLHQRQFSIVLLESMDVCGARIKAEVLAAPTGPGRRSLVKLFLDTLTSDSIACSQQQELPHRLIESCEFLAKRSDLSLRALVNLAALRAINMSEDLKECHSGLIAASCVYLCLIEGLSLRDRCLQVSKKLANPSFLQLLHDFMASALPMMVSKVAHADCMEPTLVDLFDGRLFHWTLLHCLEGLPSTIQCVVDKAEYFWELCGGSGSLVSALPSAMEMLPTTDRDLSPVPFCPMLPVDKESFLHDALSDLLSHMPQDHSSEKLSHLGPFQTHHYHSVKLLQQEPDAFTATFDDQRYMNITKPVVIRTQLELKSVLSILGPDGVASIGHRECHEISSSLRKQLHMRGWILTLHSFTLRGAEPQLFVEKGKLLECLEGKVDFPILFEFKKKPKSEAVETRRDQKLAAKHTDFIFSLLEGGPIERLTISELFEPATLDQLRADANARLALLPSCHWQSSGAQSHFARREKTSEEQTVLSSISKQDKRSLKCSKGTSVSKANSKAIKGQKISEATVKTDKGQKTSKVNGKDDQGGAVGNIQDARKGDHDGGHSKQHVSKAELAKQKIQAEQQEKRLSRYRLQLGEFKTRSKTVQTRKDKLRFVDDLHSRAKVWQSDGAAPVALEACIAALEASKELDKEAGGASTRFTFQAIQTALRICSSDLGGSAKLLAKAARGIGLEDLEVAICQLAQRKIDASAADQANGQAVWYQLAVVPQHLGRLKGVPDNRLRFFDPDPWQAYLLDVVDAGHSALILAPTASGKTFISFYIMERALRTDDTSVVVYVCPTKALANQVYLEIQARYSKTYQRQNHQVYGIFTRDVRDHVTDCQILVTVAECFQILLLSPTSEHQSWASRINYVIFDEVHTLGTDGAGRVWEQLLLLVDRPFVALSATLGDGDRFTDWLRQVEMQRGRTLHRVDHHGRYNDLQPWAFDGAKLERIHPLFTIFQHDAQRAQEIQLIPEDAVRLYDALVETQRDSEIDPSLEALAPYKYLASAPNMTWDLTMDAARSWTASLVSYFDRLPLASRRHVAQRLGADTHAVLQNVDVALDRLGERQYLRTHVFDLFRGLRSGDLLPAIVFHNGRAGCEDIAYALCRQLASAEARQNEKDQLGQVVANLKAQLVAAELQAQKTVSAPTIEEARVIKQDQLAHISSLKCRIQQLLQVKPEFSALVPGERPIGDTELQEVFPASPPHFTDGFNCNNPLHRLLQRGIGVHHAGLPTKYRQAVEQLFRMRRLGIVVSTSTLAIGINMPSKTSVFAGDSVHLNAMQFQQEAGRAGRRGFDLRGHMVFFGVRTAKVEHLLRAKLPVLQGNVVVNPSTVLRLVIRGSQLTAADANTKAAVHSDLGAALRRLMNFPLFNTSRLVPFQMAHCLRFCVEYLRREQIIDEHLAPSDLAGFIAHIYWTEPANFAFAALLRAGVVEDLCAEGDHYSLVALLSYLFCRLPISKRHQQALSAQQIGVSPSLVVLPKLPEKAQTALEEHNQRALDMMVQYWRQFAEAFSEELGADTALPFSKLVVGCCGRAEDDQISLPPVADVQVRSAFVATSGHGDTFTSLSELCRSLRSGMFCDPELVPILEPAPMLNAYLLDFYKHGQASALTKYNRIHPSELGRLQDFGFILKALTAAVERRAQSVTYQGHQTAFTNEKVVAAFHAVNKVFEERWNSARDLRGI